MKHRFSTVLIVAAVILAATIALSTTISAQSRAVLAETLDENSRGLYDLLVQAEDTATDGIPVGFADSSFVDGGGGLSWNDWQQVQGVASIDIAAPIAVAGSVPSFVNGPELRFTPEELAAALGAQIGDPVEIQAVLTHDDGVHERVFVDDVAAGLIPATNSAGQAAWDESFETDGPNASLKEIEAQSPGTRNLQLPYFPAPARTQSSGETFSVCLPPPPVTSPSILAVDPVSEQRLLGERGGFLDTLAVETEAPNRGYNQYLEASRATPFESLHVPNAAGEMTSRVKGYPTSLDDYNFGLSYWQELSTEAKASSEIVPVVVPLSPSQNFTVEVTVSSPSGSKEITEQASFAVGSVSATALAPVLEVTGEADSFSNRCPYYSLPGQAEVHSPLRFEGDSQGGSLSVTPQDSVDLNRLPEDIPAVLDILADNSQRLPVEATVYREQASALGTDAGVIPFTVDVFDPEEIQGLVGVNYVPLGGYDQQPMTRIQDAAGNPTDDVLASSVQSTGLTGTPPSAITDIRGLLHMRGADQSAPVIDAIRVRVDAGTGSWQSQLNRILDAAGTISGMGYRVDVVAGASLIPVSFTVPDYFHTETGTEPLGTVEQNWSQLGAVQAINAQVDLSSWVSLAITALAGLVLAGVCAALFARSRRSDGVTLQQAGWTNRQISGWLLKQVSLPAGVVVLTAVVCSIFQPTLVTAGTGIVLAVAFAGALIVAVTSATPTALPHPAAGAAGRTPSGSQPPTTTARKNKSPRVSALTPSLLAVRHLAMDRSTTGLLLISGLVLGVTAGVLAGLSVSMLGNVGGTGLGELAADRLRTPNLALMLTGTLSAMILILLLTRVHQRTRAGQWSCLKMAGWTPAMIATARNSEYLLLAAISALPAGVVAAVIVYFTGYGNLMVATVTAVLIPFAWAALAALTGRTSRAAA
ncbi:hypothetical protein GCM10027403_23050 [Arthrobacter tecti]